MFGLLKRVASIGGNVIKKVGAIGGHAVSLLQTARRGANAINAASGGLLYNALSKVPVIGAIGAALNKTNLDTAGKVAGAVQNAGTNLADHDG